MSLYSCGGASMRFIRLKLWRSLLLRSASLHLSGRRSKSVVVLRYLGLPVYDGSLDDLQCQHCAAGGHETTLNRLGDRALVCRNVYGSTGRLNALTSVLFAMSYCLLVIHLLVRCEC